MFVSLLALLLGAVLCQEDLLLDEGSGDQEPLASTIESPEVTKETHRRHHKTWALLAAGSNSWENYRHQADVAHAYHVLINHGVPAEQIIVMMFDDIANHPDNPYPGKLFNNPSRTDVYAGLKIDYKDRDVTPGNFLNIIKGNTSGIVGGNGRTLDSGPSDTVFVYFADHGASGLVAFPDGYMTAKDLNDALKVANDKQRYGRMVFYMEACESGSMFTDLLPDNINVFAVTAANATFSSYAAYCSVGDLPCLGDLFSVSWLEDSDAEDLSNETIGSQFELVKKEVTLSEVSAFGSLPIQEEPVAHFQGQNKSKHSGKKRFRMNAEDRAKEAWPVRESELRHLKRRLSRAHDCAEEERIRHRIEALEKKQTAIEQRFTKLVDLLVPASGDGEHVSRRRHMHTHRGHLKHAHCHHDVVRAFHRKCANFNQNHHALGFVHVLTNLCNEFTTSEKIIEKINEACPARI